MVNSDGLEKVTVEDPENERTETIVIDRELPWHRLN